MELAVWNTIALWIIATFFLVMTGVLVFVGIPIALSVKRNFAELSRTMDEVRVKIDPVLFSAQSAANDIQEMTSTAKRETDRMAESVQRVSERVDDLAALAEVVQDEIEKPLLRSAAALSSAKRVMSKFF